MAVVASLNIILKADVSNVIRNTTAGRKAFQRYGDDMKRLGREITADLMTPMERMAAQEKQLQQLMMKGYITHQTYSRGLDQIKKEYDSASQSARRASASFDKANQSAGGFSLLTGRGTGEIGKDALKKALGGNFIKGGVAGMAVSIVAPKLVGRIQEGVESGLNTIAGFLTGTGSVNQALDKIAFGWKGYGEALKQHNQVQNRLNAQAASANAAMSKILSASREFEKSRMKVFDTSTDSAEVRQGTGLLGMLEAERANTLKRRNALQRGGSGAFVDELAGVGSAAAFEKWIDAVNSETIRLHALDKKIKQTEKDIEAVRAQQSRKIAQDILKESEARLGAFGKTEDQTRLAELEKQYRDLIAKEKAAGRFSEAEHERAGSKELRRAIELEKELQSLEAQRQEEERLKKIEEERKKLAMQRRKEQERLAAQREKELQDLTSRIVDEQKTPLDRFFDRMNELRTVADRLTESQSAAARQSALRQLASTLGLGGSRRNAAIEFGTSAAFSAQRDNPIALSQKQLVDFARRQLGVQERLLAHFEESGEVVVGI